MTVGAGRAGVLGSNHGYIIHNTMPLLTIGVAPKSYLCGIQRVNLRLRQVYARLFFVFFQFSIFELIEKRINRNPAVVTVDSHLSG